MMSNAAWWKYNLAHSNNNDDSFGFIDVIWRTMICLKALLMLFAIVQIAINIIRKANGPQLELEMQFSQCDNVKLRWIYVRMSASVAPFAVKHFNK